MGRLPTVKIKADTKSGFMIINEANFNPDTMELYEESAPAASAYAPLTADIVEKATTGGSAFIHVEFDDDMEGDLPPDPPSDGDLVAAVEYCMDPEHPDRLTAAGKPQTDKMGKFLSELQGREVKVSGKDRDAAMALYIETKEA